MSKKTIIIAEAGVNHNGSLEIAKRLVLSAAQAGADAVKFQTLSAQHLVSRFADKAAYQKKTTQRNESHFEMIRRLELSEADHRELIKCCKKNGITFISSAFDENGIDLLFRLQIPYFKVPSGEIINIPYLRYLASKRRPVILSTGMCTLGEVEQGLQTLRAGGCRNVTLLHCVTEYPAPYSDVNLRAMETLRQAFNVPVGYSDHTPGLEVSLAAVALGACVIEKHFTLDRSMEGPDHAASLEPDELKNLVIGIRRVEQALGDGVKRPADCEIKNISIARKSIVAARAIRKGEKLTRRHLICKRPGTGIRPADLEIILGRRASRAIKADEPIAWTDIW